MKSYILSLTPTIGNKAKYALALMQQQTVWNKNKGLVQFLPWGRYYAEILPDPEEGVKVSKRGKNFHVEKFGRPVAKAACKLPQHHEGTFNAQFEAEQPKRAIHATPIISNVITPENLTTALQRHIIGIIENYIQGANIYEGNYEELDRAVRVSVAHEVDEIIGEQAKAIRESVIGETTPLKVIHKPLDMLIEQTSRLNKIRHGDVLAKQVEGTMRTSIGEIQQAIEGSVFSKGEAFLVSAELMGNALAMYTGYNVSLERGLVTLEDGDISVNEYGTTGSSTDSILIGSEPATVGGSALAYLSNTESTSSSTQGDGEINVSEKAATSVSDEAAIFKANDKATITVGNEASVLPSTDLVSPLPHWSEGEILPRPEKGSMDKGIMDAQVSPRPDKGVVSQATSESIIIPSESGSVTASQDAVRDSNRTGATPTLNILLEHTEKVSPITPSNVTYTEKVTPMSSTEASLNYSEYAAMSSENAADADLMRGEAAQLSSENSIDSVVQSSEQASPSSNSGLDATILGDIKVMKDDNFVAEVQDPIGAHPSEMGRSVFVDRVKQQQLAPRTLQVSQTEFTPMTTENNPTILVENNPSIQLQKVPDLDIAPILVEKVTPTRPPKSPVDVSLTAVESVGMAGQTNPVDVQKEYTQTAQLAGTPHDILHVKHSAAQTPESTQSIVSSSTGLMQLTYSEHLLSKGSLSSMQTTQNEQVISKNNLGTVQATQNEQLVAKNNLGTMQTAQTEQKVFIQVYEDSKPINRAVPVVKEVVELVFIAQQDEYIVHDTFVETTAVSSELIALKQHLDKGATVNNEVQISPTSLTPATDGVTERIVAKHTVESVGTTHNEKTVESHELALFKPAPADLETYNTRNVGALPVESTEEVRNQEIETFNHNPRKKMVIEQGIDGGHEKRQVVAPPLDDDLAIKRASAKLNISQIEGTAENKRVSVQLTEETEIAAAKTKQITLTDEDVKAAPWKIRKAFVEDSGDINSSKKQQIRLDDPNDFNITKRQQAYLPSTEDIGITKKRNTQINDDVAIDGATRQLTMLDGGDTDVTKHNVSISITGTDETERNTRFRTDDVKPVGIIRDMRYRADDSPLDKATIDSTLPGDEPNDEDIVTVIPGDPPPWEEGDPIPEKIWLIQNRHYPAWNSWSPKKTR